MKELKHNDLVRIAGFRNTNDMKVGTVRGYSKQNGWDVEASVKRATERRDQMAWINQAPSVLTADYPGKHEELAREEAARAAAPELSHGEQVLIEGEVYTVKVIGERYSDPVHFIQG